MEDFAFEFEAFGFLCVSFLFYNKLADFFGFLRGNCDVCSHLAPLFLFTTFAGGIIEVNVSCGSLLEM